MELGVPRQYYLRQVFKMMLLSVTEEEGGVHITPELVGGLMKPFRKAIGHPASIKMTDGYNL